MKKILSFVLSSFLFLTGCVSGSGPFSVPLIQQDSAVTIQEVQQPEKVLPTINEQETVQNEVKTPKATYQQVVTPEPTTTVGGSNSLSNNDSYTNVDGNQVHSPAYSNSVPAGATARCRDGTYSFSQHRSGTCSHHGGVEEWL